MDVFEQCHLVNDLLKSGDESGARSELIKCLDSVRKGGLSFSPLLNHLVRAVGLFPYLDSASASWEDRYVCDVFKADVGEDEPVTLHREQFRLLNALLSGKSIAVSAPTSFGKSFVIDSFIAARMPSTVVILVPTVALADETRRRLQRKFGNDYKIITTADQALGERSILVFPQERAIGYARVLQKIDILIVDEFYKASVTFDRERSPSLVRAIINLGRIASQRYFLAPNISELGENPFTEGMEFLRLDFNTVFLEKTELFGEIGSNEQVKSDVLLKILNANPGKTLIYAGTYANINKLTNLLLASGDSRPSQTLGRFQTWLAHNYDPNWSLAQLIAKGVGCHNGRLHRSLSQIQIKLFEEEGGLDRMLSTSSIIEGVNTSAENVVLWSNRNGTAKIDDFTYKNIIGRGGRMFRHFIGRIFVLEKPPVEVQTQLELDMPDELLGAFEDEMTDLALTEDQQTKVDTYRAEMEQLFGREDWEEFRRSEVFQSSKSSLIRKIAGEMKQEGASWNGLVYLNSNRPDQWDSSLYKLLNLLPGAWGVQYSKFVAFVKILSKNWQSTIPELLGQLDQHDIGIDEFFELERNTTFKLSALLGDVQKIYNRTHTDRTVELGPAIMRLSHAFLPPVVHQLEEYGMPRMISRKIHAAGVINLEEQSQTIHNAVANFQRIGFDALIKSVGTLDDFDTYIVKYFFDGIEPRTSQARESTRG